MKAAIFSNIETRFRSWQFSNMSENLFQNMSFCLFMGHSISQGHDSQTGISCGSRFGKVIGLLAATQTKASFVLVSF